MTKKNIFPVVATIAVVGVVLGVFSMTVLRDSNISTNTMTTEQAYADLSGKMKRIGVQEVSVNPQQLDVSEFLDAKDELPNINSSYPFVVEGNGDVNIEIFSSGSMRGEPLNALKTAMINTIQYINDDNYIGIIGFDSDVREYLPIDQFSLTQKTVYKGAVNSLDANGSTAMYNGLCVAMDRIYKKSQELGGNCTPIIFVLTDGDNNTGYEFSDTKNIIAGMDIPIYTISYNYAADSLSELASINEAAAIVGNSEDITYKLRNLFNAEM